MFGERLDFVRRYGGGHQAALLAALGDDQVHMDFPREHPPSNESISNQNRTSSYVRAWAPRLAAGEQPQQPVLPVSTVEGHI